MSKDRRLAFGELLRRHRVAASLTQQELAERAGLSVRGLSDLERGVRPSPHRDTARRLAQVLALDPEQAAELIAARAPRLARAASRPPEPHQAESQLTRRGWIARPLSSFIGREEEVAELARLIETSRLITLTGPGGIGKTRLAKHVAATMEDQPVTVVELADLTEPRHLAEAIALALGQPEPVGRPVEAVLVDRLRSVDMVLLLDNCEHLLAASASLASDLLQQCPSLRIFATSREPLAIWGETTYRVPSLPDDDAVRLFVERARCVLPSFALTEHTAACVTQLCRRLDGIPLAIELAAAWANVLSVEEINSRLDSALRLLVMGNRVAPQRQQTLRATLDWSYALLSKREQCVFERVCVFAGGWTLAAAQAVCGREPIQSSDVLELLAGLVNKSLVAADPMAHGESRFWMLETVRQYAHERLVGAGEVDASRRQHFAYFLTEAERAQPELRGPTQRERLSYLEREHDNLRAALGWAIQQDDALLGLRLSAALAEFWRRRGHIGEGQRWLERALERAQQAPLELRAAALHGAGNLARFHDPRAASHFFSVSADLRRRDGDEYGVAESLTGLATTLVSVDSGQFERIEALFAESLDLFRQRHDNWGIVACLSGQANLALSQGRYADAAKLLEESLTAARAQGDAWQTAYVLHGLGYARWMLRDQERSVALLRESLVLSHELADRRGIALCLQSLALILGSRRAWQQAARLYSAAAGLRAAAGLKLWGQPWIPTNEGVKAARAALGDSAFSAAWTAGRELSLDDAVLEGLRSDAPPSNAQQPKRDGLTRREREVVKLIARGLTNRQIGEILVISEGTAALHVKHVLSKFGFASRAQIAAWASQEQVAPEISTA